MIKTQQILPAVLIAIDIGAGVVYFCKDDPKRAVYWIAAAVLTWTVTF